MLGTSLFIFNWLYYTLTDGRREVQTISLCLDAQQAATQATGDPFYGAEVLQACLAPSDHRKARVMAAGSGGILVLGGALYLAWPALKRRRRKLRPLAPDVPQTAEAVAELSRQAGLRRAPEVLWNPLQTGGGALAFGLPWRPRIAVSPGLVAASLRDRPLFDAVIRHELAHLRNGDVAKTYLAIAIWWALVVGGILPLAVSLADTDAASIGRIAWRLAALTLLVYLTRNAILRSRESYADLRASVWDGPDGALRRVLEAMPRPARRRSLVGVHPDPAARRRLVDAPDGLFRLDRVSAFLAGAAAGVAFPSVLSLLLLATTGGALRDEVTTLAAVLVAPWVAGVLVIAAWRSTQSALARGAPAPGAAGAALALAAGLAVGQVLSLEAIVDAGDGVAGVGEIALTTLWIALLVGVVLLFVRWLVLAAEAWLPAVRRSPRPLLAVALLVSAAVLAWALGQFVAISGFIDQVREFGGVSAVQLDALELGGGLLDVVTQKNVTIAVLVALWAFPLAAAVLVRRPRIGAWAYLDGDEGRALTASAPALRGPLAIAAAAGVAFLLVVVVWRLAVHAAVPLAERDTDAYILAFVRRAELVAVVLQAAVAVVVSLRARTHGPLLGLMAACVAGVLAVVAFLAATRAAGCIDAIAIRPVVTGCPAPMETGFVWTVLKDWVAEGALLALVAVPLAAGLARATRAAGSALRRTASPAGGPPPAPRPRRP